MFELAFAAQLSCAEPKSRWVSPISRSCSRGGGVLSNARGHSERGQRESKCCDAAEQLKGHLEAHSDAGGRCCYFCKQGILNPGTKLFVVPTEAAREHLGDRVEQLMRETEQELENYEFHPRVATVSFHVSTPGVIEDRDLFTMMSYVVARPVGKEYGFDILSQIVAESPEHYGWTCPPSATSEGRQNHQSQKISSLAHRSTLSSTQMLPDRSSRGNTSWSWITDSSTTLVWSGIIRVGDLKCRHTEWFPNGFPRVESKRIPHTLKKPPLPETK